MREQVYAMKLMGCIPTLQVLDKLGVWIDVKTSSIEEIISTYRMDKKNYRIIGVLNERD